MPYDDRDRASLRTFGESLRAAREGAGISQEVLADRAGLHRTYVGAVERGERNISLLNILALARALRISPADLVTRAES